MEMEAIQTQVCKFPRLDNNGSGGRNTASSNKLGQYFNEEQEDREIIARGRSSNIINSAVDVSNEIGYARLRGWHHSSRIFRVSRASGGKDRHSKVLTSKGLRDRRVRLSVSTAIQFYDLQDRLGYDQPSKAVEWLIKAAADSISELPSLNSPFPTTPPKQLSDEHQQQQQHLSKSACSSTSETSKGSGLTLSKSDARVNNRVKARERARERSAAKEKKDSTNDHMNANHISENSSFTELLNSGGNNSNANTGSQTTAPSSTQQNSFFFHKSPAMDYLNPARSLAHHSSLFSTQMQPQSMAMPQPFSLSVENNNSSNNNHSNGFHELQHFSLIPENLIPVANGNEYNLNFSISSTSSSGLAGFNSRGTLQSNSPPPQQQPSSFFPHHYFQRFPSMDGSSNLPLFMGTTAAASSNMDNIQHHLLFPAAFDGRLQLYYNDHPDHKGKEKN